MGRKNKFRRNLLGIFKDKASLIKAILSIRRAASSSVHVAVLRATTHGPTSPPPDHRVAAVLSLGHGSRPTACACIGAIMDRLHATGDAYVALKCLITLHHVIARGSFILKDQLSIYPTSGGRNFLNLSSFRDNRDTETWELSNWVRWYAGVLERNLTVSRTLGMFISSSSSEKIDRNKTVISLSNSDFVGESDCLVGMVEEICKAPDSLHFQRNDLVYEIVNFVAEDYRSTQCQILIRLGELVERIDGLSSTESAELTRCLGRLEGCRERLLVLFVNRKRNDAFWDTVGEAKERLAAAEEERERGRWLVRREEGGESTRFGRPSRVLRLPYGGEWLDVDRGQLTIGPAMA